MSVAGAPVRSNLAIAAARSHLRVRRTVPLERTAACGVAMLLLVAPFEALHPLVRLPGQRITTVETALLALLGAVAFVVIRERTWSVLPARAVAPWALLVAVAGAAALAAPAFPANALHMAARLGLAAAVCLVTAVAATERRGRQRLIATAFASGVVVAALVVADYAAVPGVGHGRGRCAPSRLATPRSVDRA